MATQSDNKASSLRWILFALLAVGICVFAVSYDQANRQRLAEEARQSVLAASNAARVKLETLLSLDIQMVRGMVSLIVNEPDLGQHRFSQFAEPFIRESGRIKNLGAAPDMVLSLIHPLAGNEAALGLNYLTHPTQKDQAVLARDSGKLVMAGPLKLMQGGRGLIGRIPVFLEPEVAGKAKQEKRFWGLLSVVLDADKLLQMALADFPDELEIALRHKDAPTVFFGSGSIFEQDPVLMEVSVPGANWQLAVRPNGPWLQDSIYEVWVPRGLFAAMLVALLVFFVLDQRWAYLQRNSNLRLQVNRDRFASLVSNIPGVTYRQAGQLPHPLQFISEQIKELSGYAPAEFLSGQRFLSDLLEDKDKDHLRHELSIAIETQQPWSLEYRIRDVWGQTKWVQDKGRAIYDQSGKVQYLDGFLLDITETKTSLTLQERNARLNRILAELVVHPHVIEGAYDQAFDLLAIKVTEGLDLERASLWLFNAEQTEMTCQGLFERSHNRLSRNLVLRQEDYPDYFGALLTKGFIAADDAHNDPATREFSATYLQPLDIVSMLDAAIFEGGKICGVVCAEHLQDKRYWSKEEASFLISVSTIAGSLLGRKRREMVEADLRVAKQAAEQAALAKSTFLATMSHEIRTPMNGVLGMLSVLEPLVVGEQKREYLEIAKNSAQSLLSIIDDVLDFSKIEAGKMKLERSEVDLEALAVGCLKSMQLGAEQKGLKLLFDRHALRFTHGWLDAVRVNQILINLLGNALKFTEQGFVRLSLASKCTETGIMLEFRVEDSGVGIPAEAQKRLFEAFSQVDESTTRKYGGTGLGLAIVAQLCGLMDGSITLESEPGKGSCFTVRLPGLEKYLAPVPATRNRKVCLCLSSEVEADLYQRQFEFWDLQVTRLLPEDLATLKNTETDACFVDQGFVTSAGFSTAAECFSSCGVRATRIICLQTLRGNHTEWSAINSPGEIKRLERFVSRARLIELLEGEENQSAHTAESIDSETSINTESLEAMTGDEPAILVVEDNPVNQLVVRSLLEQLGYQCDIANHGRDAIEMLGRSERKQSYRLILMDCQMPEMDGYETTRYLRENQLRNCDTSIPIVALTANAMEGDKERCHAAGMDDYLSKPLEKEALQRTLGNWLSSKG